MRLFWFTFLLISWAELLAQDLRIMSFNIRYDSPQDAQEGNGWEARKNHVAQTIDYFQTDLCGLQEALHHQILDLLSKLPHYHYIGVGRDDGQLAGEFSPILYQKQKFMILDSGHFWLSETPSIPGKGWDAICCNRIVTWAKMRDIKYNQEFYFFNTHFDHQGIRARRESARLLIAQIQQICGNHPVLVTGDFNAGLQDEPILLLSGKEERGFLQNTLYISQKPHFGPRGTFNGWNPHSKEDRTIDHIFTRGSWQVLDHATLALVWEGRLASDHFAVLATLQWNK